MSGKNAAVFAVVLFSVVFALSAAAAPNNTTVDTTTTLSTTVSTTASTSVSTSVSTTVQTTSAPTTTIPINTTSTTTTIPSNIPNTTVSTTIPASTTSVTTSSTVPSTTVQTTVPPTTTITYQIYGPYSIGQQINLAYDSIYNFSAGASQAWLKVNSTILGPYTIGQSTAISGISIYNITSAGVWLKEQTWGAVTTTTAPTTVPTTIPQSYNVSSGMLYTGQSFTSGQFNITLVNLGYPNSQGISGAMINIYQGSTLIQQLSMLPNTSQTVDGAHATIQIRVGQVFPNYYASRSWAQIWATSTNAPATTAPTTTVPQNFTTASIVANAAVIAARNTTAGNITGTAVSAVNPTTSATTTVLPTATTESAPSATVPKRVVVNSSVQHYNASSQGPLSALTNLFAGGQAASAQHASNATAAITGAVDSAASSYAMAVIKTNATANGGNLAAAQLYIGLYGSIISSFFGTGSRPSNPGTSNNTANANTNKTR
ncbi:MAG: hypothetical protein KGH60_05085 [Candidatus Micrarchaeota archaeon]|nr:hypothetical protein [Candidatus Micrarchaeota archaeon]